MEKTSATIGFAEKNCAVIVSRKSTTPTTEEETPWTHVPRVYPQESVRHRATLGRRRQFFFSILLHKMIDFD
jgi:hypothetical protein